MPGFYSGIFFIIIFTKSTHHICYLYLMRYILIILFLIGANTYAQDDLFAKDYFENGEYEKALIEYQKLYAQSPNNINYINQIVSSFQQLEQYDKAEKFLLKLIE